jgi:hypothetical protein
MTAESGHWNAYAARWALIGEPLRPGASDLAQLERRVTRYLGDAAPVSALLLGVTPEVATWHWPETLRLLAVDKSEGMVRAVWPGDNGWRHALVGDWLTFEAAEPFDLVHGDGVFTLLDYPQGYAQLAGALGRLTRPGGLLDLRLFCRLERGESLDEVLAALASNRIGSFHVFKWRLAMALQGDATRGVRLADIWHAFRERVGTPRELAERTGWAEPVIATIDAYRDRDDRYSYSTEREVIECLAEKFELLETWHPSYELGDRCPHLSFRRRP